MHWIKGESNQRSTTGPTDKEWNPKYTHSSFSLDSLSVLNPCLKVAKKNDHDCCAQLSASLYHYQWHHEQGQKNQCLAKESNTSQANLSLLLVLLVHKNTTWTRPNRLKFEANKHFPSINIVRKIKQSMHVEIFPRFLYFQANLHPDFEVCVPFNEPPFLSSDIILQPSRQANTEPH